MDLLGKRFALQQFHHGVDDAGVVAVVEDRQDVRVRERSDCFRFALESQERRRAVDQARRQHFDRDVAIELGIARAIDLAHPAGADRRDDVVGAEAGSDRQRHDARSIFNGRRWFAASARRPSSR
jgi:hypothetical protein